MPHERGLGRVLIRTVLARYERIHSRIGRRHGSDKQVGGRSLQFRIRRIRYATVVEVERHRCGAKRRMWGRQNMSLCSTVSDVLLGCLERLKTGRVCEE